MDEVEKQVGEIVGNAPNWGFQNDLSLLDLMKTISDNLEARSCSTTKKLNSLRQDIETTSIDLDNTANSLRALHFGQQYVESRCLDDDDDELAINKTNAAKAQGSSDDEEDNKSPEEILGAAFAKTLKVFDKYHDKQALYIEDSDDDDDDDEETEPSEKSITYVYHAKNPYNERLLPHIYGSKLWSENWHVGLLEEEEEEDEDKAEEAETSDKDELNAKKTTRSNSTESKFNANLDTDSLASTNSQFSDWSSNPSLIQPPLVANTAKSIKNQSPVNYVGSSSRESPALSKASSESDDTRNSLTNIVNKEARLQSETVTPVKRTEPVKHSPRQPQPQPQPRHFDLFGDIRTTPPSTPTTSNKSVMSSSSNSLNHKSTPPSLPPVDFPSNDLTDQNPATNSDKTLNLNKTSLRKPINLFDDDDFNNFMTEINTKVQNKSMEKPEEAQTKPKEPSPPAAKAVDLFATSQEENEDLFSDLVKPKAIPRTLTQKSDQILSKKESNETLDSSSTFAVKPSSKFTAKSLFDDDDDEDFLNVFSKKPKENAKAKSQFGRTAKLFDDLEDDELNFSKAKEKAEEQSKVTTQKAAATPTPTPAPAPASVLEVKKLIAKSSLFDSDDDDDSLFSSAIKKPTETTTKPTPAAAKETFASLTKPVKSLFNDSDNDDDLFGSSLLSKAKVNEESSPTIVEVSDSKALKSKESPELESNPLGFEKALHESEKDSKQVSDTSKAPKEDEAPQETVALPWSLSGKEAEINTKISESKDLKAEPNVTSEEVTKEDDDDDNEDELLTGPPNKLLANIFNKKEEIEINKNEGLQPYPDLVSPQNTEDSKSLGFKKSLFGDSDNDQEEEELFQPKKAETNESFKNKQEYEKQDLTLAKDSKQPDVCLEEPRKEGVEAEREPQSSAPAVSQYSETNQKPSTAASSFPAGVFSDEPPDDDDDPSFGSPSSNLRSTTRLFDDFYESNSTPATNYNKIDSSHDAFEYKNIFLVSQLPPDDEFDRSGEAKEVLEASSKRLHSIFYDDFHETKEAIKQNTSTSKTNPKPSSSSSNQHGFFNDEPPSDEDLWSLQDSSPVKVNKSPESQEVPSVPSNESKSKIESLKAKLQESPKDLKDSKTDNNVSKLKLPKMEINVKALIPAGPGKPAFTKAPSSPFLETPKDENPSKSPMNSIEATAAANENILSSLCKNRVRPPASRKPSTRNGRKENYRKSMQAQEQEDKENEAINENKSLPVSSSSTSIINQKSNDSTKDQVKPQLTKTKGLFSFSSEEDLEDLFARKPSLNTKEATTPQNNNQPPLKSSKANSSSSASIDKSKADLLNQNNEASQPPNSSPSETKAISKPQESLRKNNNVNDSISSTSKSSSSTRTSNSSSISSSVKSSSKSLFADSSSDSDGGLFKTLKTPRNKTSLNPMPAKEPPRPEAKKVNLKKNDSLFGSSDSDETNDGNDSIFNKIGKSKPSINKNPLPSKPSKGLFSDIDSDDDDDLFGTAASKKASKSAQKPNTNPTTTALSNAKSSTQSQAKPTTSAAAAAATTTKALATQKSTAVETKAKLTVTTTTKDIKDNPLADLL